MPISSYSTTRDSNASIPPGDIRSDDFKRDQQIINSIRQLMADLAAFAGGSGIIDVLDVGSYTPTLTNVANLDASVANTSFWVRIGPRVIVMVTGTMDHTTAGVISQLRISLPVPSNIGALSDLGGAFNTAREAGTILGAAATDDALVTMLANSTANQSFSGIFMYRII